MSSLRDVWDILAKRERQRTQLSRIGHPFYSVAESLQNRDMNRYSDILAYDRTLIKDTNEGYLNANVVSDGKGHEWIATQAPLPSTFQAFWSTIARSGRDQGAVVVQLSDWKERGIVKADPYWEVPGVKRLSSGHADRLGAIHTQLLVQDVPVTHYYFDAWPDHGVPTGNDVTLLKNLVTEVEILRTSGMRIWIHCSAGVGRTGTFIAISSLLNDSSLPHLYPTAESPLGPLPEGVREDAIGATVDVLRESRTMLVQQPAQLGLIYQVLGQSKS